MRVEQERIRLLARLEELIAQQDLVIHPPPRHTTRQTQLTRINFQDNAGCSSLDEHTSHDEHATSPPSSSGSTKIGSASVDKSAYKRRQLEAVIIPGGDKPIKAPGPRKSIGKPSAGGTKTQTRTTANTTRPVKDKATPRQKSTQNPEGSKTKDSTQRVIRRVHAVVEVPIKVEDEDELVRTPVIDARGRAPLDRDLKLSTTTKTKTTELPRAKNKSGQVYRDDDPTPPASATAPRRRKSGMDKDYYEPDQDTQNLRGQEHANVRKRPPSRRKSIRELKESDFEYREEDEEEETDTDELNLGVGLLFCGLFYGDELSATPTL